MFKLESTTEAEKNNLQARNNNSLVLSIVKTTILTRRIAISFFYKTKHTKNY